jgi:lysophospholipase L1-like esterase
MLAVGAGVLALVCINAFVADVDAADFVLVGDSTIAPNNGNDGWGDALINFLSAEDTVTNRGANGRSSKSFINEGRWQSALSLAPDYILIQFGHNDQKVDQTSLRAHAVDNPLDMANSAPITEATTTTGSDLYRVNLRRMIDDARNVGAVPILVTSVARRGTPYDSVQAQINRNSGVLGGDSYGNGYSLLDYADAAKAVGLEKNVSVIDLNQLSLDLYAQMIANGEDISTLGPSGDNTHFSLTGMVPIAELVAGPLKAALVPEPSAGTLSLLSLMALGARRRTWGICHQGNLR